MSADDKLDQSTWPDAWGDVARAVLADLGTGAKREQAVRAVALQAATTWLAGESPYRQGRGFVLDTAAVFAGWIETGEKPRERL